MNVKLEEQKEKREDISNVDLGDGNGKLVASSSEQICSLRHHGDELDQLKKCQVRLPPDGKRLSSIGIFRVHADEIVSVHDSVDESIQCDGKENIRIIKNICVQPVEHENGKVMIDMEERKLSPFLSQHNEYGIPEVPDLGNVEKPQKSCQRGVVLAVGVARNDAVAAAVCE